MNVIKVKINYSLILISVLGITFLAVYYYTGNAYNAMRYAILLLSILILPTVTILGHRSEPEKPTSKSNNGISSRCHYMYGSRYENIKFKF